MEDIDTVRFGKLILVLRYCLQALWYRYRYGIGALYYVPAPGKRSALYRDWIVMALCRPFFKKVIFHWHATGLGDWLSQNGSRTERWITQMLLGRPALSIALANTNLRDVTWLHSRKVEIIPNGIPDPCPEFFQEILPGRIARAQERKQSLETPKPGQAPLIFRCLYLAHCIREKGLFDTLEGVALFNQRRPQLRVHLTVAGAFMNKKEEQEFHDRITQPDLVGGVTYAGFISGPAKKSLLSESDCICFPTYYSAESFGLTLVEAMAFGIPSVTTRWRAIPEVMPPDYPCYVAPKSPPEIAEALERLAGADLSAVLRKHFLANLGVQSHIQQMAAAMIGVGME